jgi:hypothetical protein
MPGFWYKVEAMPSASAGLTSWLDTQGVSKWQLIQVIPTTPVMTSGSGPNTVATGQVLCYFISGSNT